MNSILQKVSKESLVNVIEPKDLNLLKDKTGSIYQSLNVIAKRANQINGNLREEILEKIQEFGSHTDTFDEVQENKEQIEISKAYEKLPSPVLMAMNEFVNDKLSYRKEEEIFNIKSI